MIILYICFAIVVLIPFVLIFLSIGYRYYDYCLWTTYDYEHYETECGANYRTIQFMYKCPICGKKIKKEKM